MTDIDTHGEINDANASANDPSAGGAETTEGVRAESEDGPNHTNTEEGDTESFNAEDTIPAPDESRRPSIADTLIRMMPDRILFVGLREEADRANNDAGQVYVEFDENGVREVWPLRSRRVRRRLMHLYQQRTGRAANTESLKQAIDTIEGRGFGRSIPRHVVYCRRARIDDTIWIDLCDERWRVIKVTRDGWEIVTSPPVYFYRSAGMRALPEPVRPRPVAGGDLLEPPEEAAQRARLATLAPLRAILNLREGEEGDRHFVLAISWLLMTLGGLGAYPLLVLIGEQGTAKSSFMKIMRALCDPHEAGLRSPPRDDDTLRVATANSFVLAFDNLSTMPPWLSDALCRISTGAAEGRRQHYADLDEVIVRAHAPIILNGIVEFVTRPDLADRSVFLQLEPIAAELRMREADLAERVAGTLPAAMGALLDGSVEGLRRKDSAPLTSLPRMADFAQFASDCETAFWPMGTVIKAYQGNLAAAADSMLDTTPTTAVLMRWLGALPTRRWRGGHSELLAVLTNAASEQEKSMRSWPRTASHLSNVLARFAPPLRLRGFKIRDGRPHRGDRWVEIVAPSEGCSAAPAPAHPQERPAEGPVDQPGDPGPGSADWHPEG